MTPEERESMQPEFVKSAPSQNLLGAGAAKELAIQHLFEQVSLKRELHIAGMLLRRGTGVARLGEGVGGQAAKAARCSGDDDNFLGHGRFLSISKCFVDSGDAAIGA
jgi:hypothetical protein